MVKYMSKDTKTVDIDSKQNNKIKKPPVMMLAGMKETIRIPVRTPVLIDNGGTREFKWAITANRITVEEHDQYMKRVADGYMTDVEVAEILIVDWHMLKDVEGENIPYTKDNLLGVFNVPEYKQSATTALYEVMSGGASKRFNRK